MQRVQINLAVGFQCFGDGVAKILWRLHGESVITLSVSVNSIVQGVLVLLSIGHFSYELTRTWEFRGVLVLLKIDKNILSFIFCGVCPR